MRPRRRIRRTTPMGRRHKDGHRSKAVLLASTVDHPAVSLVTLDNKIRIKDIEAVPRMATLPNKDHRKATKDHRRASTVLLKVSRDCHSSKATQVVTAPTAATKDTLHKAFHRIKDPRKVSRSSKDRRLANMEDQARTAAITGSRRALPMARRRDTQEATAHTGARMVSLALLRPTSKAATVFRQVI